MLILLHLRPHPDVRTHEGGIDDNCSFSRPGPLRDEGMRYWEGLIHECNEQISAINAALSNCGHNPADRLEYSVGGIFASAPVSISLDNRKVSIVFEGWGPVLKVRITGLQRAGLRLLSKGIGIAARQ